MMKLNSKLQPVDSIPARQKYVPGIDFEAEYETRGRRIYASQVVNDTLVQFSGTSTASGTIAAGARAFIDAELIPNSLFLNKTVQGDPMVAIYEGTAAVGSMQIYPRNGSGITAGKFVCQSGHDWARWTSLGTASVDTFSVQVHNTAGTTANVFAITRWRYVQNNAGVAGV